MVSVQQAARGIKQYADNELLPHLTGVQRFGAAVYITLAADSLQSKIDGIASVPAIDMLNVIDGQNIDIDRLHSTAVQCLQDDRLQLDIPLFGKLTLHRADIDRIYDTILRA